MAKFNQHKLPQFYLRGFEATDKDKSHIWRYKMDRTDFFPGQKVTKHHPTYISLRLVCAEYGAYAIQNDDGTWDFDTFDTYEDLLQQRETQCDDILQKIRNEEVISGEEKILLTDYILLTHKRTDGRKERNVQNWPESMSALRNTGQRELDHLITSTKDPEQREAIIKFKEDYFQKLDVFADSPLPRIVELESLLRPMPGTAFQLRRMNWQFFVANKNLKFITSDNPVYYEQDLGLRNPACKLSFPISSKIALVATWKPVKEGFKSAKETDIKHINQSTLYSALKEVYYHAADQSIVNFIKRNKL